MTIAALGTLGLTPGRAGDFDPKLSTSLFGDARAVFRDTDRPAQSRVQLGQLVFHAIGQLDDHWGMLAEAVLEYSDATHETKVDLERFFFTYAVDDHWTFGLGKRHTPMGYWNNAYHHGAIFLPTIDRPELVKFEDDGGLQPAHDTGLWVTGRNLGPTQASLETMVSNGQTGNQEQDANQHKAVTVHADTQVGRDLVLGVSWRQDLLAAGSPLNARAGTVPLDTTLRFAGADLRLSSGPLLLLSEYLRIRETDAAGQATNWAWFAYAGWNAGDWTPYVLYQRQSIALATRVYAGYADTLWNGTGGLRYDFRNPVNLKLEVSHGRLGATGVAQDKVQLAMAFGF
jgi:hypothetical protein